MISIMCKSYNDGEITILTRLIENLLSALYNSEVCGATEHCSGCVYSNVCRDIENLRCYLIKQKISRKRISNNS